MRAEDLYAFTRRQPFVPFRIHSTDARSYEVWHPDQVIPMRSRVIVGVGRGFGAGRREGARDGAVSKKRVFEGPRIHAEGNGLDTSGRRHRHLR